MKENKVYTESFLIRKYLKEYTSERGTDETIACYNTVEFAKFLKERGFIYEFKDEKKKEVYLYNPTLCRQLEQYKNNIEELTHKINIYKDRLEALGGKI